MGAPTQTRELPAYNTSSVSNNVGEVFKHIRNNMGEVFKHTRNNMGEVFKHIRNNMGESQSHARCKYLTQPI